MKHAMPSDILIRGTVRSGIVVVVPEELDFEAICQRLREKLAQTGRFFQGSEVTVQVGRRTLSQPDEAAIAAILGEAGMSLRKVSEGGDPVAEAQAAIKAAEKARRSAAAVSTLAQSETAMVITKTLRSGQSVRHQGDVIVLGDVNPGAEVVATGHIVVMGALRGVAHAGSAGNTAAIVASTRLRPTQLRIAHVIGRAPDVQEDLQTAPEVARIQDGKIVLDTPAEPRR